MLKDGDACQFTYHCWESDKSQHAKLWHHTDQQATIIQKLNNVDEIIVGRMYRIEFADGFRGDVFEDEISRPKAATQSA